MDTFQHHDIREWETLLNLHYGKASYNEIYSGEIHIGYGMANLTEKILLNFETDHDAAQMSLPLKKGSKNFLELRSSDSGTTVKWKKQGK